jgi:hypothetical protein
MEIITTLHTMNTDSLMAHLLLIIGCSVAFSPQEPKRNKNGSRRMMHKTRWLIPSSQEASLLTPEASSSMPGASLKLASE